MEKNPKDQVVVALAVLSIGFAGETYSHHEHRAPVAHPKGIAARHWAGIGATGPLNPEQVESSASLAGTATPGLGNRLIYPPINRDA